MPKSLGRRGFELYKKIPYKYRKTTDGIIKNGAKATKSIRTIIGDREAREKHGKAFIEKVKKRIPGY